jgi:hypothetical protein
MAATGATGRSGLSLGGMGFIKEFTGLFIPRRYRRAPAAREAVPTLEYRFCIGFRAQNFTNLAFQFSSFFLAFSWGKSLIRLEEPVRRHSMPGKPHFAPTCVQGLLLPAFHPSPRFYRAVAP